MKDEKPIFKDFGTTRPFTSKDIADGQLTLCSVGSGKTGPSFPTYPDDATWESMSDEDRDAFEKQYNDAIGRTKESTGSEADDPEEPTSHTLA